MVTDKNGVELKDGDRVEWVWEGNSKGAVGTYSSGEIHWDDGVVTRRLGAELLRDKLQIVGQPYNEIGW